MGVLIEDELDEEDIRLNVLRTNRSLPINFPIIIEEIDDSKSSNSPKIKEINEKDIDQIVELVQEFSRAAKHNRDRTNIQSSGYHDEEYDLEYLQDHLRAANLNNASDDFSNLTEEGPFTDKDIPRLRARWLSRNADILAGVPEELPPFRAINH